MASVPVIPVLLSLLVGLVLGLVTWGVVRSRSHMLSDARLGARGDILLGLLVLAAFALGVFLTYALMGINF